MPLVYEENTHTQIPGPLHEQVRKPGEQTVTVGSSVEEDKL